MEWDDARARYPNIWQDGMPRHVFALETVAGRLRLGDLIAVYYPSSQRHSDRSDRYLGLSRVVGLRRGDKPGHAWVDLETAHRLDPALDLGVMPRRVFMSCDPGWPQPDVELFNKVFDAAVAAGWKPGEHEVESAAEEPPPTTEPPPAAEAPAVSRAPERLFAGADYSGNMRDIKDSTWLAVLGLAGDRLHVERLDATGRSGLEAMLRNPGRSLMNAEAIGLGFPFGLPLPFAESLMGSPFPEEGWWALARKLERITWPDYLVALQEFRDSSGEIKRLVDEKQGACSPLHRVEPDMGSRTYHGIRMIAEDRSRFAIRPFESAQGRLLLEVYPEGVVCRLGLADHGGPEKILSALAGLEKWPLDVDGPFRKRCLGSRDALDAVIAARCAAVAVLTEEVSRSPEELAPENGERVRREGWIYGLQEPA